MGNVIKIRVKKDCEAGLSGITTEIIKAGTEGFIVDSRPVVRDNQLTADMGVFFPEKATIVVMTIEELEVIENPMANEPNKEALARIISDTVAIAFQLHDAGIDLTTTGVGKSSQKFNQSDGR